MFVIRVWHEPRETTGAMPERRAFVRHVNSGASKYVRDLTQVLDFMRSHLGEDVERRRAPWRLAWWRRRHPR